MTAERMGDCGVSNHERLGADFLRSLGFSEKVSELHFILIRFTIVLDKVISVVLKDISRNPKNLNFN